MRILAVFSFIIASLLWVNAGYSLTCENLFGHKIPTRSYHNSKFELKNALNTIASEYTFKKQDLGDELYKVKGKKIFFNSRLPDSFRPELFAIHHSVKTAAKYIGLSLEAQEHLAAHILRETIKSIDLSWSSTLKQMESITPGSKSFSFRRNLLSALEDIFMLTEVDFSYEIPYLAGYSTHNPAKVYIDSGFKRESAIHFSNVNLVPFLVVHERVEKALLDTLSISNDRYLVSHQIAQRIEKAMAEAANVDWDIYQNQIMQIEINRAENPDRVYSKTPLDLDLTPYKDAGDVKALNVLSQYATAPISNKLFELKIVRPGVIHLSFHDQAQMAWTMMRFQEFYESPRFKGKVFSRKAFLSWFARKKHGYKSYSEWDGFNIPNEILEIFFEGKFNPLTKNEVTLLEVLKNFRHTKFYIVATSGKNSPVLDHEIAHSLFYFNSAYRQRALEILNSKDTTSIRQFLREKIGDYHESVLIDEVHAWLAHDSKYLAELGFDLTPYKDTIQALQRLYVQYK